MSKVIELQSGARVSIGGMAAATFVAQTRHPLWPHLRLVVWRLDSGGWSHDALDLGQDVGDVEPATDAERTERLRRALLGETP